MSYPASSVDKVRAMIAQRRKDAEAKAFNRKIEAESRSPQLREINRKMSQTASNVLSVIMNQSQWKDRFEQIRDENMQLQQERKNLLLSLGYPEDYLDVPYTCPDCSDTGYQGTRRCHCMKELLALEECDRSGLSVLMKTQSFDTLDLSYYPVSERPRMEKGLALLRDFADHFDPERAQNWLLLGGTGLGKTHVSTSVARILIHNGFHVLYRSAGPLFQQFGTFGDSGEEERRDILECEFLIIDDLGTEYTTPFTVSHLYTVINSRLTAGRSTLINTNLTPAELRERYADRITSRLFGDYTPILFTGEDIRRQKITRTK